MMKQPNGYSTPAPISRSVKQWIIDELAQTKEEDLNQWSQTRGVPGHFVRSAMR